MQRIWLECTLNPQPQRTQLQLFGSNHGMNALATKAAHLIEASLSPLNRVKNIISLERNRA